MNDELRRLEDLNEDWHIEIKQMRATIATLRKALELAYYASTLTQARETIRDALDRAALQGNSTEKERP